MPESTARATASYTGRFDRYEELRMYLHAILMRFRTESLLLSLGVQRGRAHAPPRWETPKMSTTFDQPCAVSAVKAIGGKLLVVDDEPVIRWALRKTLQGLNFEIAEAETGEQAIAMIRTIRFDAVLLDIGMPGIDGIETLQDSQADAGAWDCHVDREEYGRRQDSGPGRGRGRLRHQAV